MKHVATRTVVILGRRPTVRWDEVRAKVRDSRELVVLSVGYPVTNAQRQALFRAQDLAAGLGALLDAHLVTSTSELLAALRPEDEVVVAARGRMRRALRAMLPATTGTE
jgi:hypothetical protein